MKYIPRLSPLFPSASHILAEVQYCKYHTTANDVHHDGDHIHDFYEIYVNLNGDVSFRVENRVYPVRRGDVILTRPNEIHRCIYHGDCVHEHFCIWISGLSPSLLGNTPFADRVLLSFSEEDREKLIGHCFHLYRCTQESDSPFSRERHFFSILDLICTGKQTAPALTNLPLAFTEILLYISRHAMEPGCNVTQLCQRFFISRSQLDRDFAAHFQTTPSAYIESCRLSEAKRLLQIGYPVQYTALHCGYTDASYFVTRFRKKFGVTPLQYRKSRGLHTDGGMRRE